MWNWRAVFIFELSAMAPDATKDMKMLHSTNLSLPECSLLKPDNLAPYMQQYLGEGVAMKTGNCRSGVRNCQDLRATVWSRARLNCN